MNDGRKILVCHPSVDGHFVALYRVFEKGCNSINGSNSTAMFHVALDATRKLQPIITASIPFGDLEILQQLLSTNRVGGKSVDYDEKVG